MLKGQQTHQPEAAGLLPANPAAVAAYCSTHMVACELLQQQQQEKQQQQQRQCQQ
jgi:hypothetical protein